MASASTFVSVQQDLHFAFRTLRRNLGFALTVVATFAVGIGATTAMLTVVHTVLIQPLPYPNADRIVFLRSTLNGVSVPDFADFSASETAGRVFQALATWDGNLAVISGDTPPEQLRSVNVTPSFFTVLGIRPALGRFIAEGDAPGAVVVISNELWKRRFGGNRGIVGRTVSLDGHAVTVVGVAPPLLDPTVSADLYGRFDSHTPRATVRGYHTQPVLGRLRPGVTFKAAQAAVALVGAQLVASYPEDADQSFRIQPYAELVVGNAKAQLLTLLAAVLMVFCIGCANIASLMVARGAAREAELSTRFALGASASRVIQQLVTESVALAAVGGFLGMLLAITLLHQLRTSAVLPRLVELRVGGTAWLIAGLLSVSAGVFVGVVSAVRASRVALQGSLSIGGRVSMSRRTSRTRDAVVVLQVSASLVLLSGASVMLATYSHLARAALGFDPGGLMTSIVTVPAARYSASATEQVWAALIDKLKTEPQVVDVTAASQLPFAAGGDASYQVVGRPVSSAVKPPDAFINVVSDNYFRTMRIPMVAGQSFDTTGMKNGELAVVVSASIANSLFLFEGALGKRLTFPDFGGFTGVIVGVAGDVRTRGSDVLAPDVIYMPLSQLPAWANLLRLVVRTRGDPLAATSMVRRVLFHQDSLLVLWNVRPMSDIIGRSTARQRLETTVLGAFACCALALAALGLYGLLAYSVATRRDEFAIRYALGVQTRQLFALVLNRGMALVAIGLGIGLVLLPIELGVLRRTFAITQVDTTTLFAAVAVLALVGFGACVGPGINAVRLGTRWIRND